MFVLLAVVVDVFLHMRRDKRACLQVYRSPDARGKHTLTHIHCQSTRAHTHTHKAHTHTCSQPTRAHARFMCVRLWTPNGPTVAEFTGGSDGARLSRTQEKHASCPRVCVVSSFKTAHILN